MKYRWRCVASSLTFLVGALVSGSSSLASLLLASTSVRLKVQIDKEED